MYKDLRKTKFWDKLRIDTKLEYFIEDIMDDNKLYSVDAIANILGVKRNALRNVLYQFRKNGKIDRVFINNSSYYGNKKIVNKIKEILVEK